MKQSIVERDEKIARIKRLLERAQKASEKKKEDTKMAADVSRAGHEAAIKGLRLKLEDAEKETREWQRRAGEKLAQVEEEHQQALADWRSALMRVCAQRNQRQQKASAR